MATGISWKIDLRYKAPLQQQIQSGLDYYQKKFGISPNICHYHPSLAEKMNEVHIQNMTFVSSTMVGPRQLHIGIKETPLG